MAFGVCPEWLGSTYSNVTEEYLTLMFLVLTSRSGSRGGFDITRAEAINF
mgnify:CR=1 FL=1